MSDAAGSTAERVEQARNVWIATVRPDGRPHLVPVWYVVDDSRWYICTAPGSVKARNLGGNPHVALALEDGANPVIVEGEARAVSPSPTVVDKFKAKYDWDITTDAHYSAVYEVTVRRTVMGS
jgi:PPOX class probable F420-dependent enzyme